jgi:hypothetical protein
MRKDLKTPDFTPVALASLALVLATNVMILFGYNLTDTKKAALETSVNAAFAFGWLLADAIVRHGRSTGQQPNG